MKYNLLLIDDDELFLVLNKREVKKSGFHAEPILFSNGQDGLDWMLKQTDQSLATLIFLDINMPEIDAWKFIKLLKELPIKILYKIVLVSSSIDPNDKQKSKEYDEIIDYLEKPLSSSSFEQLKSNVSFLKFRNQITSL